MIPVLPVCGVIGAGRAGGAISRAMHTAGYRFSWVVSRTFAGAELLAIDIEAAWHGDSPPANTPVDILILAVPDSAVTAAVQAAASAGCVRKRTIAFHLSGSLGVEALDAARTAGALVIAFHPAQTFAPGAGAQSFRGIWFDMEGDEDACAMGERIASDLGARAIRLTHAQRAAAHLAMSMASNLSVALLDLSQGLMERNGIPGETARGMLAPLVTATAENISRHGAVAALTGPVSRGDAAVVREHLSMLNREPENVREIYRLLAREALRIARARGTVDAVAAAELLSLLADKQK